MSRGDVTLYPGVGGAKVEVERLDHGGGVLRDRQVVVPAGLGLGEVGAFKAADPAGTDMAPVVRPIVDAATAAIQAAVRAAVEAIQAAVEGTLAVSAASLPLPSGAATQATLAAVLARQADGSQVVTGPLTDGQLRSTAVPVSVSGDVSSVLHGSSLDVFKSLIIAHRNNQIEVDFSNGSPDSLVTVTKTSTGDATAHEGHAHFTSGSGTNATVKGVSLTSTKYRPLHEVYAAWTAAFVSGGLANSTQRVGLFDTTNGFAVGYSGTEFGVWYRRNSADSFIPRASLTGDPLDGSAGSLFTRAGVPEAINLSLVNVYRLSFGWLGSAPISIYVLSPDGDWVLVHEIRQPNLSAEASITNPDLPMHLEIVKSGAGSSVITIHSSCWAAGTTSELGALSETITNATLALMTRSVLVAQRPNGSYGQVTANTQGRLLVSNDSVGATGSAVPAQATMVGGSDGTNLRPLAVDAAGRMAVSETAALDIKRAITDYRTLLDYAGRTDGNPVYVGKNAQAAAQSAGTWAVQRLSYDASNRLTDVQVLTGAWADRASLGWT